MNDKESFLPPSGFHDVLWQEAIARERASAEVSTLLSNAGYVPLETPTLEMMEVMERAGASASVPLKLFNAAGQALAMRPDVTLQIARMTATRLSDMEGPFRFRYTQRVFRSEEGPASVEARELTQMGAELIGPSGYRADAEVLALFVRSLLACGIHNFKVAIADSRVLRALLEASGASNAWREAVKNAYHSADFVALDELTGSKLANDAGVDELFSRALRDLARIRGGRKAIEEVKALIEPCIMIDELNNLIKTFDILRELELEKYLMVDFSVVSSLDYYTGLIFEAYAPATGVSLGGGGRYDNTIANFGRGRAAAGFAFYLENALSAASLQLPAAKKELDNTAADISRLRIALSKGSLYECTLALLKGCGFQTEFLMDPGRHLIIDTPTAQFIICRPSDVPVFVASGAADCGICGKDSLLESGVELVELVDLKFGRCRFVVAEPAGAHEQIQKRINERGSIKVATKYPHIAKEHFKGESFQAEIIELRGNIELAPLTGLSDVIVDITATGTTLRENNLVISQDVLQSTARLLANKTAYRLDERVLNLAGSLRKALSDSRHCPSISAGSSQPRVLSSQTSN